MNFGTMHTHSEKTMFINVIGYYNRGLRSFTQTLQGLTRQNSITPVLVFSRKSG